MPTFVYSPTITVHVASRDRQGNRAILDISQDLTAGELTLRENGVHVFEFGLQNTQRKYDGILQPSDNLVISMSRIGAPLRVFSGSLNDGPVFSAWPRELQLSANCTLKKLQFWNWDASSVASQDLIMSWQQNHGGATADANTRTSQPNAADGGIRDMVISLLTHVVGWPKDKIHIGAIPDRWFDFATQIGDEIIKASDESALIGDLGGGAVAGGEATAVNGKLQPGAYAGVVLNADQAANASTIYNVAAQRKLSTHAAALGIGTAMQESKLTNLSEGDRDSVGLFQQRPSQGWGTVAQIMNPSYAAGKFFDALVQVPNWETLPFTVACQKVQRSGFPNAYARWEGMANAAATALSKSATTGAVNKQNAGALTSGAGGTGALASGAATGRKIAAVAFNLVQAHPPGYIRYQLGGDDPYNSPDPRVLDCSSLVDWVYYHATGKPLNPGRSTAHTIGPKCTTISTDLAKQIKGALLFIGGVGSETHVEVSMGNGTAVGARTSGIPLPKQVCLAAAGSFTHGGLLPGIDYTDAATTPAAAAEIKRLRGYTTRTSDANEFAAGATVNVENMQGGGETDVFNAFVNVYAWGFSPSPDGDVFAGPRAMMNDEPILPYVANLLAASMRSWCSAPNGDFMAWFPDYFDIWGIAGKLNVRAIELMDFTVTWSDQEIVTHQYVVGVPFTMFDTRSGSTSAGDAGGNLYWELTTQGIATMDFPQIFRALFGQDASQKFIDDYLYRFGGRPNMATIPFIQQGRPEFFMALYLFMQRWANQFKAEVPMTFMPEAWPGMLLALPEYSFQAYMTQVKHSFRFGKDGYFRTYVSICAPARTTTKTDVFGLLPLGGKRYVDPKVTGNPNYTPQHGSSSAVNRSYS